MGVTETSDEHISGTSNGELKCGAEAQIAHDKRLDAEFFAAVRGNPWRPLPRHNSSNIRNSVD